MCSATWQVGSVVLSINTFAFKNYSMPGKLETKYGYLRGGVVAKRLRTSGLDVFIQNVCIIIKYRSCRGLISIRVDCGQVLLRESF